MADSDKHSLPNLKICIENDEEEAETDNDEISFSDKDDYSFIDEPYSHRVEFSVRLNDNETQEKFDTKKYGNKDGTFVTGVDITQKEEAEKRGERARRFGLEDTDQQQQQPVDLAALYSSLGIREEDVPKTERGIRLEVVHMRGVKNMSTKDIFEYFQEFPPASVEWIEDNSCNVVWSDSLTPARALNKLSASQESMSARVGKSLLDVSERKPTTESPANEEMDENSNNVVAPSTAAATSQDDDGSVLNLEDDEATTHSEPMEMNEQPPEPKSDGELSSSSEDEEPDKEENTDKKDSSVKSIDPITFEPQDIQWPPGKWRFGKSCLLANQLFMRYATKADRKLPGAEKRSRYYLKYGNPNYGGMRGLISNSRKRKIRSVKSKDDTSSSRDEDAASMDNQRRKNSSRLDGSGASDSSGSDSCGEPEHASHVSPAPPAKQRMMRMYADDIEEELKAKRSGRQSVTHRMGISHFGGGHVKDARELLSRSDGIHRHLTNHHQYHRSHDEDDDDEEEEEDGGRGGNTMSSQYHVIKSDLRAKLERKRMQSSSSSSSASLSSASGHYPRLKIEVLD